MDIVNALEVGIQILMLIIVSYGAYQARRAAEIYIKQTKFQIVDDIYKFDNALISRARTNPSTEILFCNPPAAASERERADAMMSLLAGTNVRLNQWTTIDSLAGWLFNPVAFDNDEKTKLRNAYWVAEDLLYVITAAFDAKKAKLISEKEYAIWGNYITTHRENPLFLLAIYFWHSAGYLDVDLAKEIQKELCRDEYFKEYLQIFFPDIVKCDWVGRIGNMSYKDSPRRVISSVSPD